MAAAASVYLCLSFSFTFCSLFSSPLPMFLRKKADRGCTLSEWERATAVMGTAVGRPFSISPYFCNDDFCYKFPKLLNRFRPMDMLPDPPDVKCAEVLLKKGQSLYPLGSPDGGQSLFLPYKPKRALINNTDSLRLCMDHSILPPFPFNHSLIKAPLSAKAAAEPDDATVLRETRHQAHMQQQDPMSRQFAEVLINIGVDQVNKQKFKDAIRTFNLIIGKAGLSAGVLIGRGTALALSGNLEDAIADYSRAVELDPTLMDGWRRRAQARTAFNDFKGAAEDYTKTIEVLKAQNGNTLEVLTERAMVYSRMGDSYRSAKDLKAILKMKPNDVETMFALSQSLLQLGEAADAAELLTQAAQQHSYHKLIWVNLGMAHRDASNHDKAREAFQTAIQLDPSYAYAYRLMANLQYKLGDYRGALQQAEKALHFDPETVEARYIRGSCNHILGNFAAAVHDYDKLLTLSSMPEDQYMIFLGFYQRETATYTATKMRFPFSEFNISSAFPPQFKEFWASHRTPATLVPGYTIQPALEALRYTGTYPREKGVSTAMLEGRQNILKAADTIGAWLHSLSSGHLPTPRQVRAAGMGALEMMQSLGKLRKENGRAGASGLKGWRDLFYIAMRWMSLGDPGTAYVWNEEMTKPEFEMGFGVATRIVSGHMKSQRYYKQLSKAVLAVKEEILDSGQVLTKGDKRGHGSEVLDLDSSVGPQIEYAETPKDLWNAVGEDFLVVLPCYSTSRPKHILNGTSISVRKLSDGGGYEVTLRTISTPARWDDYDKEMEAAWKHLRSVLRESDPKQQKVLGASTRMAFYWYNMMPLAHGSAVVGHMGLASTILAADFQPTTKPKPGIQFDWEAMLIPDPNDFKGQATWLQSSIKHITTKYSDLPDVQKAYPTVSSVFQMLDIYDQQ